MMLEAVIGILGVPSVLHFLPLKQVHSSNQKEACYHLHRAVTWELAKALKKGLAATRTRGLSQAMLG